LPTWVIIALLQRNRGQAMTPPLAGSWSSRFFSATAARRIVIVLALIVVLVLLTYDLVFKEFLGELTIERPAAAAASFHGQLMLTGVKYDVTSRTIRAMLHVEVNAIGKDDINSIALVLAPGSDHTKWLLSATKDCQTESTGETADQTGKRHSVALYNCNEVPLNGGRISRDIWYPFDSYEVSLSPQGCINNPAGACLAEPENLSITTIRVALADTNLMADSVNDGSQSGTMRLVMHRRFFVRMVSIVFLILSILFLAYVISTGDPADLLPKSLGFFAALWGLRSLIVPSSLNIFPTIVDYCILSQFCVLFLVVLLKLSKGANHG
jgi:hypothetical protein